MRASFYGRLKEMELLLAMGSEVDYQNNGGRSALMSAARNNQPLAIELLIQWGICAVARCKRWMDRIDVSRRAALLKQSENC